VTDAAALYGGLGTGSAHEALMVITSRRGRDDLDL